MHLYWNWEWRRLALKLSHWTYAMKCEIWFSIAFSERAFPFHFFCSDNSAGQQKSDSHSDHPCSIVWSLGLVSIDSLFKVLIFPGSSLMDGIQGDLREQACCSSSVGCFQSFLLLFFFFFFFQSPGWLAIEMISKAPGHLCCQLMWAHTP